MLDLAPHEVRVLGCLIEKQKATPDVYPLSLNALRLACNQSTNRDPVVDYDEATVRDALQRLGRRRWTRLASGHGSRAAKYRHLLDEALGLTGDELALLAVLMLRGPQTPGELKARTERLHAFSDLAGLVHTLDGLVARELVVRLPRRPGQKEERYAHELSGGHEEEPARAPAPAGGDAPEPELAPASRAPAEGVPAAAAAAPSDGARLDALEREVATLREELAALRAELGA